MKVLLAVGGGIAAYKSAELARLLMQQGHQVQVVMTRAAEEFVRPLTFAALTGRKVLTNLFAIQSPIEHIAVAQEHELLVIAPATADLMAKLAHGLADDFLTTLYLAFTGPVLLAPAMNVNMWQHPATQANLATLVKRGHTIVEPGSGYLACGMSGPGRLADPEIIAAAIERAAHPRRDLEGETVPITAGPTPRPPGLPRSQRRRRRARGPSAARSGGRNRADHGRPHPGAARPGALHFQPLQRQDGLRARRRCRCPRGSRNADFRPGPSGAAARRRSGRSAHRRRNARPGDATSPPRRHRYQGGCRSRFPPQQGPGSQGQENRRADLAGTRPHARHPGRTRPQRTRFPAGRLRRRNSEFAAGSAPQAGVEELRYGGRQPGRRERSRLRERRKRSRAHPAHRRNHCLAPRLQARHRRPHFRRGSEPAPRAPRRQWTLNSSANISSSTRIWGSRPSIGNLWSWQAKAPAPLLWNYHL